MRSMGPNNIISGSCLCGDACVGRYHQNDSRREPKLDGDVETHVDAALVGDMILKGFHRPVTTYNVLAMRSTNLAQ
jgi:hypothetical protein